MMRLKDYTFHGKSLVRDLFIETGTYHGQTLLYAALAGFHELHSIECHRGNFEIARESLAHLDQVHVHFGSSPAILPRIIDPSRETTFWLDAHYQGGLDDEQSPDVGQCPLIEELHCITAVEWEPGKLPYILIDDAHLFLEDVPAPFIQADWPRVATIQALLEPRWRLTVENDCLFFMPGDFE